MLFLVRNGVPYDEAWALSHDERLAYVATLCQMDGARFNWQTMSPERGKG